VLKADQYPIFNTEYPTELNHTHSQLLVKKTTYVDRPVDPDFIGIVRLETGPTYFNDIYTLFFKTRSVFF